MHVCSEPDQQEGRKHLPEKPFHRKGKEAVNTQERFLWK